jgi:hypothetical protein
MKRERARGVHYAPGSRARADCVRSSRAPTRGDGFGVKEKKKASTGGLCPTVTMSIFIGDFSTNFRHKTFFLKKKKKAALRLCVSLLV